MFKHAFNLFMPLKMVVSGHVPPNRVFSRKRDKKKSKALVSQKPFII